MQNLYNRFIQSSFGVNFIILYHKLIHPVSFFKRKIPIAKNNYQPFFIVGSGRSGNTLLRAILSVHDKIVIPPEFYKMQQVIKTLFKYQHKDWNFLVEKSVDAIYSSNDIDTWELSREILTKQLLSVKENNQSLEEVIHQLYTSYGVSKGKKDIIWGDKSPINTYNLFWISKVFPKAKYIHLVRDGRDVSLSYFKSGIYDTIKEAAKRWVRSIQQVYHFKRKINSENFLEIKYETMVEDPEKVIRMVCRFLSISYADDLIRDYKKQSMKMGDTEKYAHHQNIKKNISTKSIGKWKEDSSRIREIYPIVKPLLNQLSYTE